MDYIEVITTLVDLCYFLYSYLRYLNKYEKAERFFKGLVADEIKRDIRVT